MKEWSFLDDNLDIVLGIERHTWGLEAMLSIFGDLNTFVLRFGPLFFAITYWRLGE